MQRCLLTFLMFVLAPLTGLRAQVPGSWTCEAPEAVRTALAGTLPTDPTRAWPRWDSEDWTPKKRTALAESLPSLLERSPGDFWVERARIDAARNAAGIASEAVIAEFQRRYQAAPNNPEAAYLHAYSLINKDTARTIEILTAVTAQTPAFPPAWMTLANISNQHFRSWAADQKKAQSFAEGYLQRCPGSLEADAISLVRLVKRPDALLAYTKRLRERIAGTADATMLGFYSLLWTLESKSAPQEQLAEVRATMAEDIKFLDSLDKREYPAVTDVLSAATAGLAGVVAPGAAFAVARNNWDKANPSPKGAAGMEAVKSYYQKRLAFLEGWMAKSPDRVGVLSSRLSALAALNDTPNEVLAREGDKLLAAARASESEWGVIQVAGPWAKRGVALERVPGLVKSYLNNTEYYFRYYDSDLRRGDFWTLRKYADILDVNVDAWEVLAAAYSKAGKLNEARAVLKEWETALASARTHVTDLRAKYSGEVPSSPGPHPPAEKFPVIENKLAAEIAPRAEESYKQACARLAEAEGRKLDALAYYQTVLRAKPASEADPTIVASTKELWRQLGGTAPTWQMWQTSQTPDATPSINSLIFPAKNNWLSSSRALIDFALPDRNGRKWTLADIKSKTTFINVWATWCGPCRAELPQVQALYDKISGRKDVQVITLSVDDQKDLVGPFLKEYGYTFPVIYASDLFDSLVAPTGGTSIPQCWISDSSGVVRLKLLDSDWPAEKWLQETLTAMDKVH